MTLSKMVLTTITGLFVVSTSAYAEANKETRKEDAPSVNQACAGDATTAGCSGAVIGKGLGKCLYAYRQAHKDFKLSQGCHEAMHDRR